VRDKQQLIEQVVKEILDQQKSERVNQIGTILLSYVKAYNAENITEDLFLNGIIKLATELSTIK
jgi:hypothetical protein